MSEVRDAFLAEPLTEHEEYCLCAVAGDGQGFTHPTYCLNLVDVVAQALRKRCPSKPSGEAVALAAELADARRAKRFLQATFRNDGSTLYKLAESLLNDRHGWIVKAQATPPPIPMLLTCPACGERHIDVGEFATKPHHTHACQHCGHCWRPAVVHTTGVRFLPGFKNEEP
jgi:hypothetical protein